MLSNPVNCFCFGCTPPSSPLTRRVAQVLVAKGANVNHQNRGGQTAAHYAMAYNFFDLGAWLLDPDKGGASDEIENEHGLGAYDGLEPDA